VKPPVPAPGAVKPPVPGAAKPPSTPNAPDMPKPTGEACPTCGRVSPGRPGARYCMMCDKPY
jgi:hypothetical protein